MKCLVRLSVLTLWLGLQVWPADSALAAGPYADDLSKCLVRSTTDADKTLLVQWMFAMASLHPDVKWMVTISESQRAELTKKAAGLFEGVLTQGCLNETKQAMKFEGEAAIESSFNVLGQVAARELFSNPSVAAGLADLGKQLDSEKLKKALGLSK